MISGETIAVLDVGTARVKIWLGTPNDDGCIVLQRRTVEVARSSQQDPKNRNVPSYDNALRDAIEVAEDGGATRAIAVATEAFRSGENAGALAVLERAGLAPRILSGAEEGWLFFVGVSDVFGTTRDLLALDIGGGSVQLIWEEDGSVSSRSLGIGTFALERRFGPL